MTDSLPGLREMQLFIAVYETGSFTAAAEREFATQSGISHNIKQLEECLGVQLFDRQKAVEPTEAGTVFYQHCLQVLTANTMALQALSSFERGLTGEVRFGVTPTLASNQLAPAYLCLMEQHPNASIAVIDAPSNILIDRVRSNELDFAIIPSTSQPAADLITTVFATIPAFLVSSVAHNSGFEHGEVIGPDKLVGLKLLAPDNCEHTQWTGLQLDLTETGPNYQLDAVLATQDLIRQSDWMAILPGLLFVHDFCAGPAERDFRLNPFSGMGLNLELLLVQPAKATPSPLVLEAIRAIQDVTQEHIELLSTFQLGASCQ